MRYVCNREEMQAVDACSIRELGIPGIVLMEKAAMAMEQEILARFPAPASVLILAERGNNGGDGLALGRLLLARGYQVTFCEIGGVRRPTDSYVTQREILDNLGVPVISHIPDGVYDLIIDSVFGVGLTRDVAGIQQEMIEKVNAMSGVKIAVDVPSGVNASDGQILGCAFKADVTITFGLMKIGLLLYPGASFAGEVVVKDIGFPALAVERVAPKAVSFGKEDLLLLPKRHPWSNKGSYGKVLLIVGSKNMAGAAYLSSLAAYRAGCGLVRIFTCEENRQSLQTLLPEAIMTTWTCREDIEALLPEAISWADVIGIGPGIGQSDLSGLLLERVLSLGKVPLVIDADGINVLARELSKEQEKDADHEDSGKVGQIRHYFDGYPGGIILTPHLKEMERLCGRKVAEIQKDLIVTALLLADPGHVVVLKDARTIVADGRDPVYINQSGNHGMAVGGSGDVLMGIICGFLAGGLPLLTAARLGVYCHGLAGDEAAAEKGYYGLNARDIAQYLAKVIH